MAARTRLPRVGLFKHYGRKYGKSIIPPDSDEFTSDDNLFNIQAKIIQNLAEKENCIIVGRCADHVLAGRPRLIRVFIDAPMDFRIHEVETRYGLPHRDAIREIEKIDRARAQYYRYYTGQDWHDARNYDICLNSAVLGFDRTTEALRAYLNIRLG